MRGHHFATLSAAVCSEVLITTSTVIHGQREHYRSNPDLHQGMYLLWGIDLQEAPCEGGASCEVLGLPEDAHG